MPAFSCPTWNGRQLRGPRSECTGIPLEWKQSPETLFCLVCTSLFLGNFLWRSPAPLRSPKFSPQVTTGKVTDFLQAVLQDSFLVHPLCYGLQCGFSMLDKQSPSGAIMSEWH